MKEKILIISGDPNSINSEIIFKSWKKVKDSIKKKIYVISNLNLLQNQFKRLKYRIQLTKVNSVDENIKSNKLKIIDIDLKFKKPFDVSQKLSSNFVIDCLNYGHWLANNKKIKGIINCAIDKKLLNKKKIGVTEYLASKCKIKDNSEAMLICNDKFAVCPLTTHLDIKDIPKKINQKLIISKIKTIDLNYRKLFKKKPKIGILGLNPHNAELRNESEEKKIRLIEKKLNIKVPRQETPSYEAILNSKVDSWIDTIKKTPINSNLKSYLPRVIKNFRNIDKESLIELILSKEFEKHDLNLHVKNSNDHVNNKKLNSNNNDRFFINIGARDQYDWQTLKDFLRSYLKIDKNDISQVEVMKNFSFFSVKKNHSALVLKSFENLTLDNRKVSVELTKKNKTFSFTSNQKKKKNNNKRRFQ